MADGPDPESKTEDATPRKLEEARKKGDVAKSPDVAAALSLAGAAGVLLAGGGWFSTRIAEALTPFLAQPHAMIGGLEAGGGVEIGMHAVWAAAPFLAALMFAVILGGVNAFVRPLMVILTLPLTIVTFGLFLLVVNAAMIGLTAMFLGGFVVDGLWAGIGAAIVTGVVSWIAGTLFGGVDERR